VSDIYELPNIDEIMKLWRLQWAKEAVQVWETNAFWMLMVKLLENGYLEHQEGWRMTLRWVLGEVVCEVGLWIELDQDHFQWGAVLLVMLNFQVLLPQSRVTGVLSAQDVCGPGSLLDIWTWTAVLRQGTLLSYWPINGISLQVKDMKEMFFFCV